MTSKSRRILFCCPTPVVRTLGAAKVYIEAAEGFRRLGWDVKVVGPDEVAATAPAADRPGQLLAYLREHASAYAVVEYEQHLLPFARREFTPETLFVARSVLLTHHGIVFPTMPTLRGYVGKLLNGWTRRRRWRDLLGQVNRTLAEADFINVANHDDARVLTAHGHLADRIGVFPYGLFPERLAEFAPTPEELPRSPVVAFVGTFDPRKGMVELPRILGKIADVYADVELHLIGTAGLIPTAERAYRFFPRSLRRHVKIVPRFDPEELPGLLAGCSLGVFPSWVEGFGFGVLEMLAAGLPVIAYDVPGPPMMLARPFLVPRGDAAAMAGRVVELLRDPERLRSARRAAARRAGDFSWERIARDTAQAYTDRRAARSPVRSRSCGAI